MFSREVFLNIPLCNNIYTKHKVIGFIFESFILNINFQSFILNNLKSHLTNIHVTFVNKICLHTSHNPKVKAESMFIINKK